jgi:hypothetical protein
MLWALRSNHPHNPAPDELYTTDHHNVADGLTTLARTVSAFDAVALSESKRALDAMPASISGWRPSFEYGLSIYARIRSLSAAQGEGLSRFSAGEKNPGQGRLT